MKPIRVSIVVPVYGCVGCLEQLCARLKATLDGFADWYEIILVDDRSPDNSWAAICRLKGEYAQVRGLRLSRNFGQHIAITAGLSAARGDYAVVMDCDLQDPPEMIPQFFQKLDEGHDLALGRRATRGHSGFRNTAAKLYFGLLNRLTEQKMDGSYGTFSLLSRKVVDSFLSFREPDRHYLFIVRWLGFNAGCVDYKHQEREIGCSSYSFKRLVKHAVEGMFFQSTVLLRWIACSGMALALIAVATASYLALRYLFIGSGVAGWTSLMVLTLFCTGAILTCVGVVGLYIGKIFEQTKNRPLYIVDIDTGSV